MGLDPAPGHPGAESGSLVSGGPAVLVILVVLASVPWWSCTGGSVRSVGRRAALAGDDDAGSTSRCPRGGSRSARSWPVGARRGSGTPDVDPDPALLLDLVAAALAAGAPVPRALSTVADALPGRAGAPLRRAAGALTLGSSWQAAWADAPPAARAVADALEPTAAAGASPVPLLRAAAAASRRRRRAAGRAAAGRVGVWLVLPLGLCFLPAFLLLGVVPVVLSIAGRVLG